MLACHAAILARKAGRPVKMIYDRVEDLLTCKRHPSSCGIVLASPAMGVLPRWISTW